MMNEIGLHRNEKLKTNFFSESAYLQKAANRPGRWSTVDKLEMLNISSSALTGADCTSSFTTVVPIVTQYLTTPSNTTRATNAALKDRLDYSQPKTASQPLHRNRHSYNNTKPMADDLNLLLF